jgi:pimeloyl-ACP methyl ester carboxylesterase
MTAAKPLLIFSHANGFSASTYSKLFRLLEPQFQVAAVERFGHTQKHPVTNNWPHLVDELGEFVSEQIALHRVTRAHLVGHSLGGFLSLLLTYQRPELVDRLVLLDSPILTGKKALLLRLAKALNIDERYSPARFAKVRRTQWPSVEAARAHFASKALFTRWDPDMLSDYANFGTREAAAGTPGRELMFSREVEYQIFRGFPDHLGSITRHPLPVPFAFVRGSESEEMRLVGMNRTAQLAGKRLLTVPGGHLFPMEHPEATANAVTRLLTEPLA